MLLYGMSFSVLTTLFDEGDNFGTFREVAFEFLEQRMGHWPSEKLGRLELENVGGIQRIDLDILFYSFIYSLKMALYLL